MDWQATAEFATTAAHSVPTTDRTHRAPTLVRWYVLWALIFVMTLVFGFISAAALLTDLPTTRVLAATGVLLIPLTFLSYLPLIFFISFTRTERNRGLVTSLNAIHEMGWDELADDIVAWHREAFRVQRYPIPITIALLTFYGWWTFVFFHAGTGVISDFAATQNMQRLMQAVEGAPPVGFAFLGSYFFSISFLFFRYMRADLGPGLYINICIRTWTVTILALVVTVVARDAFNSGDSAVSTGILVAIAFLGGITPPVLLNILKNFVREKLHLEMEDDSPELGLQLIAGLSPFKVARLNEEGIEDVQNLAMQDPARLIVVTQESGLVVLDWVDQALLRCYVPRTETYEGYLKDGIRTAYDLYSAGKTRKLVVETDRELRVTKFGPSNEVPWLSMLPSVIGHPSFRKIKALREEAVAHTTRKIAAPAAETAPALDAPKPMSAA